MSARNICRYLLPRSFNLYSKRPYNTYAGFRRRRNQIHSQYKHLIDEFPTPKEILWRLLNEAYIMTKNADIKPIFQEDQILNEGTAQRVWKYSIYMKWPKTLVIEGISSRKHEAESLAYLRACQKMKELNLLDNDNNPLLSGKKSTFYNESIASAKTDLLNLCQRIYNTHGRNPDYLPKFEISQEEGIVGKVSFWKCKLHLAYPEKKSFESCAGRVKEAEGIAAAEALLWLEKEKNIINTKRQLINYSKDEEEKLSKNHFAPYSICLPSLLQDKMLSVLQKLNELTKDGNSESFLEDCSMQEDNNCSLDEIQKRNLITDEIYQELSEAENINRSREMFQKYISHLESSEPNVQEIRNVTSNLPIASKKNEILKQLNENQVVVLSGDTGCGKTTQVPQYILDEYIAKLKGANCNIIISQPRRISAISIAERIAYERGEQVGETIGYHVRLKKNLPKQSGAMLFCSTGMLLRKLCFNPNLDGISHVIVDEVHERSMQIDILLILLKRLLESNKNIKILIMSASFNTFLFSQYFNNCPVIHVPGNVYPVKEYYLEKLPSDLVGVNPHSKIEPILDVNLVANAINFVHKTQKGGAILCFLPGWHDILAVQNKLLEICEDPSELKICRAHSRLPHEEQKMIFEPAPDGVRKIILTTNIAETSITINDVVYVVDSGLHKGTTFDGEHGAATLATQWITKANVRQRRGRAGRVQHGVCYHLFPQQILTFMEDYPKAEILRMPLESVILDCKLYCPNSKAEDFLSTALQPPSQSSLQIGVHELQQIGVLDENENLTDLGKVIVKFAAHPRLSLALVYASFLGCLDPILTICTVSTLTKEPFLNTLEDKSLIKTIKQGFANYLFSDHLAITNIFEAWNNLKDTPEAQNFLLENLLDEQSMHFIKDLKALFAQSLFEAGIIESPDAFLDPENICNINRNNIPCIFSVLSAAFYPNVMKVMQGDITQGKIDKDAVIYSLVKGQQGYIQRESVASTEFELPSPWLVYFKALHSEARRKIMTSAVSPVPGICLLLFAGQQLTIINEDINDPSNVILMLDNYKKLTFSCKKGDAELLLIWRNHLKNFFRTYIQTLKSQNNDLSFYNEEFLPVLKEIISTPQVPFTKGQLYKFVNNELVSEEF
ncbi:ATP-dependent RNA helicase DHX30-like isoform X2 [Argiope bruennichi]|uniref:ATP-dependent RNA helicase DHX30-like isoform X2 n=1 Tax=Argiope bruennichi TaxID=94029 RepID=UPI002494FA05|nr:ATP-dependent RNA helicase DHX30-like isoform X2 [Argiope bruennichi]